MNIVDHQIKERILNGKLMSSKLDSDDAVEFSKTLMSLHLL